jgi:predicted amidohydrolase
MHEDLSVTAAQISMEQCWQDPEALTRNADKILAHYLEVADSTDLVVFPELSLFGYIPLKGYDQRRKAELAELAHYAAKTQLPRLREVTAGRRAAMVVGFMEPSTMRNEMYNAVSYLENGVSLATYRKAHLPVEENHYFIPGDTIQAFDTAIGRVAMSICYDLMFPEIGRLAALQGASLLLIPSNWLDIANLRRAGEVLPPARALEGQMNVVFVNGVGELEVRGHTWTLFGRSTVVAATGEVLAVAGTGEELLTAKLTVDDLRRGAGVFPLLRDRRPELYGPVTSPLSAFARRSDT